ncbi:MAG: GDP-L-fucose synthase [Halobacteriota archaeon]|jgi:GDP-L-fucose synthase
MRSSKWNAGDAVIFCDSELRRLKIAVTGGRGFLGRYVVDALVSHGASPENIIAPLRTEFDLRSAHDAAAVVADRDLVIHLAARVGGIGFNQCWPADLIYDNTMMGLNVIEQARKKGVQKLLVAGTVCAYPKFASVPFKEVDLWNGYPEETNAPYGLAKRHMLVMLQAYRQQHNLHGVFLLPANLYGPHDNFDVETSHVIPAMIRKFVEAKNDRMPAVELWGDGSPSREFLFIEDCARAFVLAALRYDGPEPINLGTSEETNIRFLAETIRELTGYQGEIVWNSSRPNGQAKRQLDVSRAKEAFGFEAKVALKDGLQKTISWYLEHQEVGVSRATGDPTSLF